MTKCNMKILAIETSCDETAASVVAKNPKENYVKVLSNVVASSLILHSKTGGIIPDIAAREQLKFIIPVIEKAIENCKLKIENLDAIAVTYGPGLIGSLLIGVETAKTLSYLWNKPIIPVNHLFGHIYANWIYPQSSVLGSQLSDSSQSVHQLTGKLKTDKLESENRQQKTDNRILFPAITLLVSGGHTDLLLMENHNNFKWLGGTLDDAAGEAFDKIGRLLNLPYPAGPTMEALAKNGNSKAFTFPRPMIGSKDFDFSFSGLKAAAMREVIKLKKGVAKEEGRPDNAQRREHWREGLLLTGPQLKKEVIDSRN
ncbi:MAG: putative tRNA threonylcarbamoyladenosine biosynthesis protein Gcp [Candidatus Levybacteria bacterium GW2011_GWC2_37_7]|nr:MAG: putative tRNA threonylcarbamoyladenosine biosynthesis protein Gcp [Candidatus Levybacteria bacterium GW2011_GWC2_37_7]